MARIEFRTERAELGGGPEVSLLVPHVDGVRLVDWLRRVELASAQAAGEPQLAGAYAGLPADEVRWPRRHLLGEPALTWSGDGDTVLLGCTCGDWGCWPFTARVTVGPDTVTWSDYRNGHRDWDHAALPDLVFDRAQYEQAVRATALP